MSNNPRREVHFPIIQTPTDTDYVPLRTRNPQLKALVEGKPRGIRIPLQQRIGIKAASSVFETLEGPDNSLSHAANFLAVVSIGTAHHAFLQRKPRKKVMYHRAKLPNMISEEGVYTTHEELMDEAKTGLQYAAGLAEEIEGRVMEQLPTDRLNERLARSLARTGLHLAVIGHEVTEIEEDLEDMQETAWEAGQGEYMRTIELSGRIGARPTFAQLADAESPLRRSMHDSEEIAQEWLYQSLKTAVDRQL